MSHQQQPSEHFLRVQPQLDRDALKSKQAEEEYVKKESDVREWIEKVVDRKLAANMHEAIGDGIVLCQVLNKMFPGSVPRIHPPESAPFQLRENITKFLAVCTTLQVPEAARFAVEDLFLAKNMRNVYTCIQTLADMATKKGFAIKWTGDVEIPFAPRPSPRNPSNSGAVAQRFGAAAGAAPSPRGPVGATAGAAGAPAASPRGPVGPAAAAGAPKPPVNAAAAGPKPVNAAAPAGPRPLNAAAPAGPRPLNAAAPAGPRPPNAVAAAAPKPAVGTGAAPAVVPKLAVNSAAAPVNAATPAVAAPAPAPAPVVAAPAPAPAPAPKPAAPKVDPEVMEGLKDAAKSLNNASTTLHVAASRGDSVACSQLAEEGADVHARRNDGATPLHVAVMSKHPEAAAALVAKGASTMIADARGVTPTAIAAASGDEKLMGALAGPSGTAAAVLKAGKAEFFAAITVGNVAAVEFLCTCGFSPDTEGDGGVTALRCACSNGKGDVLRMMIDTLHCKASGSVKGIPLLLIAIEAGNSDTATVLVDKGAEINSKTEDGWTPLQLAITKKMYAICTLLLEKGSDANYHNAAAKSYTALHLAVGKKAPRQELVQLLLDNKANPNERNENGMSALHMAVFWGHSSIAHLLLEKGADPNLRTETLRTALDLAVYYGHQDIADMISHKLGQPAPKVYQNGHTPKRKRMPKPAIF